MITNLKLLLVSIGLALATSVSAGTVTSGEFVLDFDEASLLGLSAQVKNEAWFDSVSSADKTTQEMMVVAPADSVPDSFSFKVFGTSIPTPPIGLAGRFPQASTFKYDNDPETGSGHIGLAGLHVVSTIGGSIIFGDYDLSYDAARIGNAANGSGWYLTNRNTFTLIAFDLSNVQTTSIDDENFTLSGDVVLAKDLALMLQLEAGEGVDVGDFSFTTVADAGAFVDATIANYSSVTEILTLPVVMANMSHYSASFRLLVLDGGRVALELESAEPTSLTSETHAMFDMTTGIFSMPEIVLLDSGEASGNKVKATMKLEPGYFPSRFILTTVEDIAEHQHN